MGFGVEAGVGEMEEWGGGSRRGGTQEKVNAELVEAAARLYRLLMFEEATDGSVSAKGRVLPRAAFWRVNSAGGGLSRGQLLRCRIRYLTEGAVIGSRTFVEDWFFPGCGEEFLENEKQERVR